MRSLSVIIPNYNGEVLLVKYLPNIINCLESYSGNWELIIVDDQSKDKSVEILKIFTDQNPKIKIIKNEKNLGFSGTCNVGIKASSGEILFFLNNDVTLKEDFFNYFNRYFDSPDTFAVTVTGYLMNSTEMIDGAKFFEWKKGMPRIVNNKFENDFIKNSIKPPYPSHAVQGAYFFADANKINSLNGFDELFSPYIFEESDLSFRALKRGWKIYFEPRSIAYHAISSTISKKKKRSVRIISTKNKITFVWKNISNRKKLYSHLFFLGLRLLLFNYVYWKALIMALKNLTKIKEKRKIELSETIVKDEKLFKQ